MATENRSITKALGGAEDLLIGRIDQVTQTRNGNSYQISGIDVPVIAASTAAVSLLDPTTITRARVYSSDHTFTDYVYSSTATTGLPSTGAGKWVARVNEQVTVAIDSVADLSGLELPEGTQVYVTGYHDGTTVGGGSGVIKTARHNGGTAISLTRTRPPVWGDNSGGAMDAWFADSGSDELCFVRTGIDKIYIEYYGALGDGVKQNYHSIQKTINSHKTSYAGEGVFFTEKRLVMPTQASFIGLETAKQYGTATTIISNRESIGEGNSIIWFGGVSTQAITINNILFRGDTVVSSSDLSSAVDEGIYGIDPSGCKQGLDLSGNSYRGLRSGIKRVVGNNYIGFTKLNNSNFNGCYECLDFTTTTGVDISGCTFYDNYKIGHLNRIVGDNVSFNNSNFSAEESGLSFDRAVLSNVWLEGYNNTLNPTEYLEVLVGYFSESYSLSGSSKFSLLINNNNVLVKLRGVRIGTNTRLVKLGAGVTDLSTITFDLEGCRNGTNFAQVSDVYAYTREGLNLVGKSNTQPKYNINASGVSIVAGSVPTIGIEQAAPIITKKLQFTNQVVFSLDLNDEAFYDDPASSTGYDSIIFNLVGSSNGAGGTSVFFGQLAIYNGFGANWEYEILSTADSTAWTVTLTDLESKFVTVTIDDNHAGSGNAINPVSATNNFMINYISVA